MAALMKLMILAVCLNLFTYLGAAYYEHSSGSTEATNRLSSWQATDLFDVLLDSGQGASVKSGISRYMDEIDGKSDISRNWTLKPNASSMTTPALKTASEEGIFQMADPIKMILGLFGTILNIITLPFALMFSGVFPLVVGLILGIPLIAINFAVIALFFRGTG